MASLSAQTATSSGVLLTFNSCAGGGDTVPFGSECIFRNTDAGTVTVTVVTPNTVDGNAIADKTFTVAQNEIKIVRPTNDYRDTSTDRVSFTYSGVTALTMAVVTV